MKLGNLICLCLLFSFPTLLGAQDSTKASSNAQKFRVYPLPVIYYTPETRFAFGAVALNTFRFPNESASSRISQFQIGAAYTQEDQLLVFMPFDIYFNEEKWYLKGTAGHYRYSYYFYGVGNEDSYRYEELYKVNYNRFRIDALRLVKKHWYAGVRYWYDDYQMGDREADGLLDRDLVSGSDGGLVSTFGLVSLWDSRNNYNYPSKGNYLETLILANSSFLGSDFDFSRYSIDYVNYSSIGKSVWANNVYLVSHTGNPPFNEMAFIGGRNKMRGYYLGRFRDKNLIMIQSEWRKELFWKIGMTVFSAFGNVAPELDAFELKNTKGTAGLGLRYRLNPEDKINIRLDYAVGENGSSGLYITFGEAF